MSSIRPNPAAAQDRRQLRRRGGGPLHLRHPRDEPRERVVARFVALLREAHARGARVVVFPELALTTFFPRWWMEDQGEIDAFFETEMPGPAMQPLSMRPGISESASIPDTASSSKGNGRTTITPPGDALRAAILDELLCQAKSCPCPSCHDGSAAVAIMSPKGVGYPVKVNVSCSLERGPERVSTASLMRFGRRARKRWDRAGTSPRSRNPGDDLRAKSSRRGLPPSAARGRRQPAEQLLHRSPDCEEPTVGSDGPVELDPDRQSLR